LSELAEIIEAEGRIIRKEADGYHVYSEDGSKHLGGPYKSMGEAKKRLEQIDYFKNKGKNSVIYTTERRFFDPADAEVRITEESNGTKKLTGFAAVYHKLSQNLGPQPGLPKGFREQIHHQAFDKVLKTADVRGLRNHEPDNLLGRTKSGTMRLESVGKKGLRYEIDVPPTVVGRDTVELVNRRDLDGSSFSFLVDEGGDEWDDSTDPPTRTVHSIRDLFDVGPVTYPAYLDSTAGNRMLGECRSYEHWQGQQRHLARVEQDLKAKRLRILRLRIGVIT
jgi:uncharacterized protein